MDLNALEYMEKVRYQEVSLREKGVDLNVRSFGSVPTRKAVSLREKGVDLNEKGLEADGDTGMSPFVRREWI